MCNQIGSSASGSVTAADAGQVVGLLQPYTDDSGGSHAATVIVAVGATQRQQEGWAGG